MRKEGVRIPSGTESWKSWIFANLKNFTQKLRNFPCEYAILTETQATSLHRKQTFLASDAGSTPGYVCQGQTFATTELDKSDANDDCCDLERKID